MKGVTVADMTAPVPTTHSARTRAPGAVGPARLIQSLFPLNRLPHRIRYRIAKDILRRSLLTVKVFDFDLVVPIQVPGIGKGLSVFGHRELDQYFVLHKVLRPGDAVLDIGANIGYYARIEGKIIGPTGFIHAFEPDPRNVSVLKQNLEANPAAPKSETHAAAISNVSGPITFQIAERTNLNGVIPTRSATSNTQIERGMGDRKYIDQIEVPCVDLVEFLEKATPRVNLIRMDVEGHEVQILGSLAKKLAEDPSFDRAPDCIVFEPHSWEYAEEDHLEPVLRSLLRSGYSITYLGSRSEPDSPMSKFGLSPIHTATEARGITRGVYANVPEEVAVQLAARTDGVTTVCLQRA